MYIDYTEYWEDIDENGPIGENIPVEQSGVRTDW